MFSVLQLCIRTLQLRAVYDLLIFVFFDIFVRGGRGGRRRGSLWSVCVCTMCVLVQSDAWEHSERGAGQGGALSDHLAGKGEREWRE